MHPLLNIAIKAARNAGKIIIRSLERVDDLAISEKGHNDFVTEIDKLAEQEIINTIHAAYPHHALLTEESGADGENDYLWVVDPLDGTTNYIHGFPCFAVSIAVKYKNTLQHGVIYDPFSGELFTASRGAGAHLNNRRIRVSQRQKLTGSLIGIGFPYRKPQYMPQQLSILQKVFPEVAGFRSLGSAALNLANVAAGRLDGVWFCCLKEWDIAAGILLIQEAGGLTSNYAGEEDFSEGNLVAGNPKVFKALLKAIKSSA